ncbi:MAG TPA: hypothetical protein VK689_11025, partial [Armatimonadota bacterium]|nr:hypothetical protein [Armatimonadota bacterium]
GIEDLNVSIQDEARADSIRIAAQVDSVLLARARATGQDTTPFVRSPGAPGLSITLGPPPDRVPALLRPLARRSKETEERLNGMRRREAVGTLRDSFVDNAPTGIFLMMPLFALILKLLYARRKRFYVEHFVFALHVHSFAFLLLTVMMVLKWEWLNALLSLWFIVALYIAMKRVYGQGWFKTLVKYLVLAQAYGLILIVGVTITIVLATLTV